MPWYRAYVDKKTTAKGGGEHSRIIDGEAKSADAYERALDLEKDEQLGQIVELTFADQANV